MVTRSIRSESGFTTLMAFAIALPVIVLLASAVFDLSREPETRDRLEQALYDAAYGVDRRLGELFVTSDRYTPAANNLCSFVDQADASCEPAPAEPPRSGFLSGAVTSEIVIRACELAHSNLSQQHGIYFNNRDGSDSYAVQFALLKISNPQDGSSSANVIALSDGNCLSRPVSDLAAGESDAYGAAQSFGSYIAELSAEPLIEDYGLYPVIGAAGTYSRLPSFWLVGVAYARLDRLLRGEGGVEKVIRAVQVRPLNVPLAFERESIT